MKATKFPNVLQSKTIAAGGRDTVYIFRVPKGDAAFIESVACVLPEENCFYKWDIDGEPVEEGNVDYSIASIDVPKRFDPPIVVKNWVRFIGVNNSSVSQRFDVLCDGFYSNGE